jgi:L-ribulose-5-phosphate 4-epimerase
MYEELKKHVWQANLELVTQKLVIYTWGNVSAVDRQAGVVAIKPSGVPYDQLTPEMIVITDLDGKKLQGDLAPSSDCPTHLELYRHFTGAKAVCHVHSHYATIWAQACRPIPCLGTTHADYFYGPIPVTEPMTEEEIGGGYEINTGKVIVRRFRDLDPIQMPAVLVANHGPFTWGASPQKAVENAVVLEQVAAMALGNFAINPRQPDIPQALLDKHYFRKHGQNAYYGQKSFPENRS